MVYWSKFTKYRLKDGYLVVVSQTPTCYYMPKSSIKTLIIHFIVVYVIFLTLSSILGVVMRGRPLNSQDFIVGAVVAGLLAFRRYLRDKALKKDNTPKTEQ